MFSEVKEENQRVSCLPEYTTNLILKRVLIPRWRGKKGEENTEQIHNDNLK